jgi:hypothetical protein
MLMCHKACVIQVLSAQTPPLYVQIPCGGVDRGCRNVQIASGDLDFCCGRVRALRAGGSWAAKDMSSVAVQPRSAGLSVGSYIGNQ